MPSTGWKASAVTASAASTIGGSPSRPMSASTSETTATLFASSPRKGTRWKAHQNGPDVCDSADSTASWYSFIALRAVSASPRTRAARRTSARSWAWARSCRVDHISQVDQSNASPKRQRTAIRIGLLRIRLRRRRAHR